MPELQSPYREEGTWLRGNLHTHSTNSDGVRDPELVAQDYGARGYDFLAISDHDVFTDPEGYEGHGVMPIPSVEVSTGGPHTLHIGATTAVEPATDRQAVVDAIRGDGGIAIPAHPNWDRAFDHWPQADLRRISGYAGLEIYNGLVEQHPGSGYATDRWDQLLSTGRRVWGYANDDAHRPWEVAKGWTVAQVDEETPEAVVEALAAGRCYASSGVSVTAIETDGGAIHISTENADTITLRSDHGVVQQVETGPDATFRVPRQLVHRGPEFSYVRIECDGPGNTKAWLQPFFLE